MTSSAVLPAMPHEDFIVAQRDACEMRMISAPRASDALTRVFRTAFGSCDDAPDDFRGMLDQIDRLTTATR
jgi:hypothetical protein